MRRPARTRSAFTLIEILVAVAVLVVVVLVCGQAFQAASGVARMGEASGSVLQESWAIEKQIREDLSRLSPDGSLIIHSVEVPNDYNRVHWDNSKPGPRPPLINPSLPADAPVRCDQLMFFIGGFEQSVPFGANLFAASLGGASRSMGSSSAVTYGHGLQFPELSPYSVYDYTSAATPDPADAPLGDLPPQFTGHDIDFDAFRTVEGQFNPASGLEANLARVAPFYRSNVSGDFASGGWGGPLESVYSQYGYAGGNTDSLYDQQAPGVDMARFIRGDQPEARRWMLTRRLAVMGDDDSYDPDESGKKIYNASTYSTKSLFPVDPRRISDQATGFQRDAAVVDMGRADMTSMLLGDVRKSLLHSRHRTQPDAVFGRRPWFDSDDDGVHDDVADGTHAILEDTSVPGLATQRHLLKTLMAWPRVERAAPGPSRYDQSLTNQICGSACSSFIVEWTWDDNVGETRAWKRVEPTRSVSSRDRVTWHGFRYAPTDPTFDPAADGQLEGTNTRQTGEQFWFGMPDKRAATDAADAWDRGVTTFRDYASSYPAHVAPQDTPEEVYPEDAKPPLAAPALINPRAVDEVVVPAAFPGQEPVREYWATFGPNRRWPLLRNRDVLRGNGDPASQWGQVDGLLDPDPSYTPWPSALRFTMVLHDTETNLEHGKLVQFVVELPKERLQ
jgi:prepilin-type N-terminal cleavage/methylation domain-containing protein